MSEKNQTETSEEIYQKLQGEIESASWAPLEEHHQKGALIIVGNELDLCEVGAQVALDNVEIIKSHLKNLKMTQPSEDDIKEIKKDEELMFRFIIVQPYVLCQKKVDDQ